MYHPLFSRGRFQYVSLVWFCALPVLMVGLSLTEIATHAAESSSKTSKVGSQSPLQAFQSLFQLLNESQRKAAVFDYQDAEQRVRWSNLPTSMVPRKGLRMGDLKPEQVKAVHQLLAAVLSPMGYEKVVGIMQSDEELRLKDPNGRMKFGLDEFYLSFVGTPSEDKPWILQFGGHHLALNVAVRGKAEVLTPSLTAVQPAVFQREGKTIRPLGREVDKAFAVVQSLNPEQQKAAILGSEFRDLVLGPGHDGKTIQPEGVKANRFTAKQRQLLLELIQEWVGIADEKSAAAKMKQIRSNLDDTWFAWSGPTETGKPAYFRIQGPTLVIEFAPQKLGGDATQHLHTIYRDPTNDYGVKGGQ